MGYSILEGRDNVDTPAIFTEGVPSTEGEDEKKDRFQLGAPSGLLRVDQFFGENWIMVVSCFDLRTLYSQTEKKWVHPLATP